MAEEFAKVVQLCPGTSGVTMVVKVVDARAVLQKGPQGRQMRLAECLVGDDTAIIVFIARGDQVELMKPRATVILHNAKVDMFRGSMRLSVDRWGRVEPTEDARFEAKEDSNLSLIEFE
ncbi:hypothetical protein KI387_037266, partial [Taxus chinensis]